MEGEICQGVEPALAFKKKNELCFYATGSVDTRAVCFAEKDLKVVRSTFEHPRFDLGRCSRRFCCGAS